MLKTPWWFSITNNMDEKNQMGELEMRWNISILKYKSSQNISSQDKSGYTVLSVNEYTPFEK